MSTSIDERIVEMKFDGAGFVDGIKSALGGLNLLKKGLALQGASSGIQAVQAAADKFTLASIGEGVQQISNKFTAMGVVAITALANIANKAVNFGLQIGQSLTIAPISAGFDEYELKMGSIQTILANTSKYGTSLEDVTKSLDALNDYSDKTIYNFGDMTRNIGLFTNAGLRVEEATSMIKGFSNEAAASGTSASAASGAAYQLSQALSKGKVTLEDFRSLTNAGMGNKNMQRGLIDIANAMGTLQTAGVSTESATNTFTQTLEKGWLTADVMSKYLQIMAGDMDAATQASLGLSDAQIETFRQQQKMAEEAATKVRTFSQLAGTLQEAVGSTWAKTFDITIGNFTEATELFTNISDRLGAVIGAAGDARNNLLQAWKDKGGRVVAVESIQLAFDALMALAKPIKEAFTDIFPPATGEQLFKITEAIRDFMKTLVLGDEAANNVKRTFRGLFAVVDILWMVVKGLAGVFGDLFTKVSGGTGDFLKVTGSIGDFLVKVRDAIKNGEGLTKFFETLSGVLQFIVGLIGAVAAAIVSLFTPQGNDETGDRMNRWESTLQRLGAAGEWIRNAFTHITDALREVFAFFRPVAQAVGTFFGELGSKIAEGFKTADFSGLLDFLNAGLFGGLLLLIKKFLDKDLGSLLDGSTGFIDGIKSLFEGLTGTMEAMQTQLKSDALIKIAIAIAILTASLVVLSTIDSQALALALTAITAMFIQLGGAMLLFEKFAVGPGLAKMPILAGALILLATAILILSVAVKNLSDLSWEDLLKGLAGVTVLLGGLVFAAAGIQTVGKGMIPTAIGLVILAAAIKILVSAVMDLSGVSWEDLAKGLVGVGVLLGSLILFTKFAEANKRAVAQGVGLVLLAVAIKLLVQSVAELAGMDWESLGRGFAALGGLFAILAIFVKVTGDSKKVLTTAAAMVVLGAAMKIMASALGDFASLSWDEIGRGLLAMAGAMAIVVGAMLLLSSPTVLIGAAAVAIVSAAMTVLADAMKTMGSMSWDEIGRGMVVLAGSLAILAGALYLMSFPVILIGVASMLAAALAMMMLAPALVLMGSMTWDEIGRGLTILASALAILAVGGVLMLVALPGLLGLAVAMTLLGVATLFAGVGVLAFATAMTLLGTAGAVGAVGLTVVLSAVISLIPLLMQKLGEGVVSMAGVITAGAPAIAGAMVAVLLSIIDAIVTILPAILDALMTLVMALVNMLVENVPLLVDAGLTLLTGILSGIADNIGGVITTATDVIVAFLNGISSNMPRILQAGADLIIGFVESLASTVRENSDRMNAAGADLADAIIDGMTNGIFAGISTVINAAQDMASKALQAAKDILGIASPSKEFTKVGKWTGEGMERGIRALIPRVVQAAKNMGGGALDAMKQSVRQVSEYINQDMDSAPVIRPVVDMTDVKRGFGRISALLPDGSTISLERTDAQAATVASSVNETRENEMRLSRDIQDRMYQPSTFEYNQTIQSPKPVNELEVYRQTNNLLSTVKDKLK